MDCIRLRGADGQIAASDSYQALIQTGFQFPWTDEILVMSSRALESPDFVHAQHVEIGRIGRLVLHPIGTADACPADRKGAPVPAT